MSHLSKAHTIESRLKILREVRQFQADYERRRGPTEPLTPQQQDESDTMFRNYHRTRVLPPSSKI